LEQAVSVPSMNDCKETLFKNKKKLTNMICSMILDKMNEMI
jgi:hypothetical protein